MKKLFYKKPFFILKGCGTDLPSGKNWKRKGHNFFTKDIQSAFACREFAGKKLKIFFKRKFLIYKKDRRPLAIPENKKLKKFQRGACYFVLSRNRSYLNLKPGLGKTIVAAVICSTLKKRALYLCPPFLASNVLLKFRDWAPELSVKIYDEKKPWECFFCDVLIFPDSRLERKKKLREEIATFLKSFAPVIIVIDEQHRFKAEKSGRTRALNGFIDRRRNPPYVWGLLDLDTTEKVINLSGTPAPNGRPIELWPTLKKQAHEKIDFCDLKSYGKKYCAAYYDGFGLNYDGINRGAFRELMDKVQSDSWKSKKAFMYRVAKSALKLERPIQELVVIGEGLGEKLKKEELNLLKKYSSAQLINQFILSDQGKGDENVKSYQRLLGIEKSKVAAKFLKEECNLKNERVIIFAKHIDVVSELEKRLNKFSPLVISGKIPIKKRDAIIEVFQTEKKPRPLIGNIDCMGLGLDIQKTDRMIFIEWSDVPGINSQGIDRAYRMGRKKGHLLLVQWLVLAQSFDYKRLKSLEKKEKNLELI